MLSDTRETRPPTPSVVNENPFWKFPRISRSPAYLLQFYDRRAMKIYFLFFNSSVRRSCPPPAPRHFDFPDRASMPVHFAMLESECSILPISNLFFASDSQQFLVKGDFAYWNIFREGGIRLLVFAKNSLVPLHMHHHHHLTAKRMMSGVGFLCIQQ